MADNGMIIRISANVAELKKALADGTSTINTTTAGMMKLASSLDGNKLIAHAQNIVASVNHIGGATKLTEAEKARLNVTLTKAVEKYQVLGQIAPKAMTDLQAATTKVSTETEKAAKSSESWKSQLGGLAGAFGIAFSVGAVVGFGKELLKMADGIVKVADTTGLSIKEVQQFTYIAGQSGNTIEELTGAIGQMQNRLAGGDESAVAAVKHLGINFDALVKASPAKQMEMIAAEIAKIPDPAQRTVVAMDLFGRAGMKILPTLTSQFGQLAKQAPIMSDASVRALDRAGDGFARLGLSIKVWAGNALGFFQKGFESIIALAYMGVAKLLDVTASIAQKIPGASTVLAKMGVDVAGLTKEAQWFRDAASQMAKQTDVVTESAKRLTPAIYETAEMTKKGAAEAKKAAEAQKDWAKMLNDIRVTGLTEGKKLYDEELKIATEGAERKNTEIRKRYEAQWEWEKAWKKTELDMHRAGWEGIEKLADEQLKKATANMERENALIIERLMNPHKAAIKVLNDLQAKLSSGAAAWRHLAEVSEGTMKSVASNIAKMHEAANLIVDDIKGLLEAKDLFGLIMASVKLAVDAIGLFWNALFGPSKGKIAGGAADKDLKALQDDLLKTYGSIDKIREVGGAAGQALADAWGSKNVDGLAHFKDLLDKFNQGLKDTKDLTDALKQKQDLLTAAVDRYKFTIEELGPALRNQKLSEQAEQILDDFKLLSESGIDVDTIIKRMSGSINDFVRLAVKTGTEVPAAMRPILESMIQQGLLTDANGVKITSLTGSGITFGETLTQGFRRVVEKLEELIQRLTGPLPDAFADAADVANQVFEEPPWADWQAPEMPDWDAPGQWSAPWEGWGEPPSWDGGGGGGGGNGGGGGGGGGGDLSPDQLAQIEDFVARNGESDRGRAREALGFAGGTGGRFLDFGAGTPVTLHGKERVVTEAEGRSDGTAREVAALRAELARDRRMLPGQLGTAIKEALALGGRR